MAVTYSQYIALRDWFIKLHETSVNIEKSGSSYIIRTPAASFQTSHIETARQFLEFLDDAKGQGWSIEQDANIIKLCKGAVNAVIQEIDANLYNITDGDVKIVGPVEALMVYFCDCLAGHYDADYKDKTVLDIGGFFGETAVYFNSQGATKIIIYEPALSHQQYIEQNLKSNLVNAEVHAEGIAEATGEKTIHFDSYDLGFGLTNQGQNEINIKTKKASDLLLESNADIAKIDCKGAETSLLEVPADILRRINLYFIEAHSSQIQSALIKKFEASGFEMIREPMQYNPQVSMLYFKRRN